MQYLTFIDPHGLRNENGFNSDRIKLSSYLQNPEKEFDQLKGVKLNSFILSPASFYSSNVPGWDSTLTPEQLLAKCDEHNLIEITPDANADPIVYIRTMVKKILTGSAI